MNPGELIIQVVDSPEHAPNYAAENKKAGKHGIGWLALDITSAIIVCNGTEQGNPTVDLQLQDKNGNKYVAIATGGVIEALGQVVNVRREMAEAERAKATKD